MTTRIRPLAEATAGEASAITAVAVTDGEVVTACRDGSDNLLLIGWSTPSTDASITRGADTGGQAGEISAVALAVLGRHVVTAVRDGSDNLLMIPWEVAPGLASITRLWDGTGAGEVSLIAMTTLRDDLLITAVRNGSGNLELISWRLEPDATVSRLHDSGSQAGEVTGVTITALDADNVITAVRNGSGDLELIGWSVDGNGTLTRWPGAPGLAGTILDIALDTLTATLNGVPVTTVLTAVTDGSGNLLLIAWAADPAGGFSRLTDAHAGEAIDLSLCSTTTSQGTPTVLVSMRQGSGNLKIIAFDLLGEAGDVVLVRTGDYANRPNADVAQTALVTLDSDRILSACRTDDDLDVTTYELARSVITLIRPWAETTAGEASSIAVAALDDGEVVTACRDGSDNLLLIGWSTPRGQFTIEREADTAGQAGEIGFVALAVLGRHAVTAVQDGSGNLLMIPWEVAPGLGSITRSWEGTHAGEVWDIAMTTLRDDLLITAVRNGSDNLELISWRLEPDATVSRLHDSGTQAGEVTGVTITALDADNVITAVRNGSGDLELIGWTVDGNGTLTRWPGAPGLAGGVGFITLDTLTATLNGVNVTTVLTAVTDASGNLLLIAWTADPADGFSRVADAGAGEAIALGITTTITPQGTPTVLVSMRQGSGNLKIIAFDLLGEAGEVSLLRTGDFANRADSEVTETALLTLDSDRILSACCNGDDLDVTTYQVIDAGHDPAPQNILRIQFQNPPLPTDDFSKSDGEFPLSQDHEWVQVLAPDNEYDEDTLVGCAGWVVGPNDSGADVPMTHALGFDWEYGLAPDDDAHGFLGLLSPANKLDDAERLQIAEYLGVAIPKGLLGVEWDKPLLPPSFRGQVNNGDRVAVFGRWIIDTGHVFDDHYRTEVHPPLLMASAGVHTTKKPARQTTRMLVMSRPYLHGQEFAVHVNNVYNDAVDDDGAMFDHLLHELERVVFGRSLRVEAHPKIKERPYRGRHQMHLLVEPPPINDPAAHQLVVSYQFTVRSGCNVRISAPSPDRVDVEVDMGPMRSAPPLPARSERTYDRDQLDKLSSGSGVKILGAEIVAALAGAIFGVGALYVALVLRRGIRTDEYDALPAVDIHDTSHAVIDVPVGSITPGAGVAVDDTQPWPVIGWLEASWVPRRRPPKG